MIIKVVPYIYLNGNAEEAMSFYKNLFKMGKMDIMRYKETNPNLADTTWGNKVIHGYLAHDKFELYFSDMQENSASLPTGNISLTLEFDCEEEIRRVYEALAEGGKVDMSLDYTFWDALYGSLSDKYGVHWDLNCQKRIE